MKRILVPTDFSNNAYNALYYATRLFKNEPCKFYILNTCDINRSAISGNKDSEDLDQEVSKRANEKLTETLHSIVRDTEDFDHTFGTILSAKKLLETIEETVKSEGIDLIVMGTKGATGAKGFFIGSNTSNIIEKTKCCPVLAVPDEFNFEDTREIAFSGQKLV
ncbi:universal stress protein [Aquimarina gracilis]|uniref:Universal stress protein n=1 Tax=Aquimarina gracilis TaxID=874422 RepID=A0ABU5ZSJ4_9FLAO|nr:universal stress protein [Aquimarina gracilis]MEB3345041.1 universal stress protein [Aquimarina gracilis]